MALVFFFAFERPCLFICLSLDQFTLLPYISPSLHGEHRPPSPPPLEYFLFFSFTNGAPLCHVRYNVCSIISSPPPFLRSDLRFHSLYILFFFLWFSSIYCSWRKKKQKPTDRPTDHLFDSWLLSLNSIQFARFYCSIGFCFVLFDSLARSVSHLPGWSSTSYGFFAIRRPLFDLLPSFLFVAGGLQVICDDIPLLLQKKKEEKIKNKKKHRHFSLSYLFD